MGANRGRKWRCQLLTVYLKKGNGFTSRIKYNRSETGHVWLAFCRLNSHSHRSTMRFSVITPSFKQLDWLDLCAASVADQSVELEHLVQDAGTPGIERWAEGHPLARVFVEKDAGMYDAINRGLRRATGSICSYLNCDEQYLPGTLRRVGEYFEQHPEIDVLFGDSILTDASLQPLSYRRVILPGRWHTLVRPLGVLTCSTFFRRKVVEDGTLFDPAWKIIGDKAWVRTLFAKNYRMGVLPEPLAVFALTGANLSQHSGVKAEHLRWKKELPAWVQIAKPLILAKHLLTKWKKGAYEAHPLDSAWYSFHSPTIRQRFTGKALGWKWPAPSSEKNTA
jgi:glycosyltransferase involved in cell wall biosynthesis